MYFKMKTIEEATQDFADSKEYAEFYSLNRFDSIFNAGAKFAQKWIPFTEEKPPLERVLLKTESGYVEARTIKKFMLRDLKIYLGSKLATHWRKIEIS